MEQLFRSAKSLLAIRQVFHHQDATIRGHVFCSFLALVLRKVLLERLEQAGLALECGDLLRDLEALEEVEIEQDDKRLILLTRPRAAARWSSRPSACACCQTCDGSTRSSAKVQQGGSVCLIGRDNQISGVETPWAAQ